MYGFQWVSNSIEAFNCGTFAAWNHNEQRFERVLAIKDPDDHSVSGGWEWFCPACVAERVSSDPEFAARVILSEEAVPR